MAKMQSPFTVMDKIFEVSAERPSLEEVKAHYFDRGFQIVENNGVCGLRVEHVIMKPYGTHEAKEVKTALTVDDIQKIIVDGRVHWPFEEMMDGYTGENPHPYTEYARTIISRFYFGAKTYYTKWGVLAGSIDWYAPHGINFKIATEYNDPANINWVMLYADKPIGIAFSHNLNSYYLADVGIWAATMPLATLAEMHLYQ